MDREYYQQNRQRLYEMLDAESLLVLFAGTPIRKSADSMYPFHASRNFLYLTGIEQKQTVLLAQKHTDGTVS